MTTTLNGIALPPGLIWEDEFAPVNMFQSVNRTIDGGLVIQSAGGSGGRPITLVSRDDSGWVTRLTMLDLFALSNLVGGTFPLVWKGFTSMVYFRHESPPAFEATPLYPYSSPTDGDYYLVKLRLATL